LVALHWVTPTDGVRELTLQMIAVKQDHPRP
jgi:hypothetical protein